MPGTSSSFESLGSAVDSSSSSASLICPLPSFFRRLIGAPHSVEAAFSPRSTASTKSFLDLLHFLTADVGSGSGAPRVGCAGCARNTTVTVPEGPAQDGSVTARTWYTAGAARDDYVMTGPYVTAGAVVRVFGGSPEHLPCLLFLFFICKMRLYESGCPAERLAILVRLACLTHHKNSVESGLHHFRSHTHIHPRGIRVAKLLSGQKSSSSSWTSSLFSSFQSPSTRT